MEDVVLSHAAEADHSRRGLFGASTNFRQLILSIGMQRRNEICAVIHRDLRPVVQGSRQMFVIGRVIFTFDGKDRNLMKPYQGGRDVVLRAQRV